MLNLFKTLEKTEFKFGDKVKVKETEEFYSGVTGLVIEEAGRFVTVLAESPSTSFTVNVKHLEKIRG